MRRSSLKIDSAFTRSALTVLAVLTVFLCQPKASAQITNTVFSDDFSASSIDPSKYQIDAPFFEGGKGDIAPTIGNGVVEFTGTVTEQWWAGATLRLVPTYAVSDDTNIVVSVDRVAENGQGTSSRSALWIMDSTRTTFVLFADNSLEGHWEYNRKINEAGDTPTGSGTAIAALNAADGPFVDGGLHRMKAVANGKTVRLYLDDTFGAEVKFPFTNLVFEIGSYARANGDVADTIFDNLKVETVGAATFSSKVITLSAGQTASNITVRIPPGANATAAIQVRVVSGTPAVAVPIGAVNGTLTLTFPAGGSNTQTFNVQGLTTGGSVFTLANDIGLVSGNTMAVTVVNGAGVRLQDDFAGNAIDTSKWQLSDQAFETGVGTFTQVQNNGALEISGTLDQVQYWGGASVKSAQAFTATKDLPLSVTLDRVSVDPTSSDLSTPSTAARTGIFLTTADRSQFVFFGQDAGETGWEVNVNPGNPTGSGTAIPQFASITDTNKHQMKLVADGDGVDVYLDGQPGGRYDFSVNAGIYVEIGAYARAIGDNVNGTFDNAKVENVLPCITALPDSISTVSGQTNNFVTVTIPKLLNSTAGATVTVTSSNPSVAVPQGAVNGVLTLNFPATSTNVQTFLVNPVGIGSATLSFANAQGNCIAGDVKVTVTTPPATLFSDDFSAATIDSAKWTTDMTPLRDGGAASVDSAVTVANQAANFAVTADVSGWPGIALMTTKSFTADTTSPVAFEIDRVKLGFTLITGTAAKEFTGVWITDTNRSQYVLFGEWAAHDGTAGGWQYFRSIGQAGDSPVTGNGVSIPAFSSSQFNEQGNHHMIVVANGSTVKLFLDGVAGPEVSFPVASGIVFEFGAYVQDATDIVTGIFDNALVTGSSSVSAGGLLKVESQAGGNILISWTGAGTLQSADALNGAATTWTTVSPAPAGTSFTVTPSLQVKQKFYRLSQ